MPAAPSDVRDLRRDAVRLAHSAGRTRDRTANAAANALSNTTRNNFLSSSSLPHTLLPSGQIYTGALAPPASLSRLHSSPSSTNLTPNGSQTNLYLATAPGAAGSSTGLGYGLTAPDNMRAQKQAAKEKKAKIKKRKAAQAQVAASALAGRSESSLLLAPSGSVAPPATAGGIVSGRASPAAAASARGSGDEQNLATTAAAVAAGAPRMTRRSSSSSNVNNTTVTVVASTTNAATSTSISGVQTSSTGEAATPAAAATSPARTRRRRTQGRASGVGTSSNPIAAASELASQTESRPYNLYQEMLGASSDEERALGEDPVHSGPSTSDSARLPAHTALAASSSTVSQPNIDDSNPDAQEPVQLSVQDADLAAAQAPEAISIPAYPPPAFPSGSYSTRPRTPPTPPPPLRPPDPTMSEAVQQEERAKERAWEAYRAKWIVPDSPPPAFRSDDEDDAGPSNRAQRMRSDETAGDGGNDATAANEVLAAQSEAGESDLSSAESEAESISSARRAWEEDLRSGYDLPERIAREAQRRAAASNAAAGSAAPATMAIAPARTAEQGPIPDPASELASDTIQRLEQEHDEPTRTKAEANDLPPTTTSSPEQEFEDAESAVEATEAVPQLDLPTSSGVPAQAPTRQIAAGEADAEHSSSEPGPLVTGPSTAAAADTLSIPASEISESSEDQWQAEEEALKRMEAERIRERPISSPSDLHINRNDVESTQHDRTVQATEQSGKDIRHSLSAAGPDMVPPSAVESKHVQNVDEVTKHDGGIRSSPISDPPSDPTRIDSEASQDDDDGHSSMKLTTAETSESSDEQWAAEDEAFERLQAKEQAVLRLRLRAEEEDSSDDEPPPARSRVSGGFKRSARDVVPPSASSPQQRLQALADLQRTVPRAPPPLALGRSRSGAAFSSSSEESSDEDERRLESTGSEPENEVDDGTSFDGSRRSSAASSTRSVDQTALAAFNYLRARTLQLTGRDPMDDSLESSPGGHLLSTGATRSIPSAAAYAHRQPPFQTSTSRYAHSTASDHSGTTASQPHNRAHFVENAADDDAIAALVASQFSSAQKGKAPVRPTDHLLSTTAAAPLSPSPIQQQRVPPAVLQHRPLPVPPRITTMRTPPLVPGRDRAVSQNAPPQSPPQLGHAPVLPPRPSEIDGSPPDVSSPNSASDRRSVGSRLKGLFGTPLEGAGSGADLIPSETAGKIRDLFDQPVIPRPSIETQKAPVNEDRPPSIRPAPMIAPAVQIRRVDSSDEPRRPGANFSSSSIPIPASPVIMSMEDAKEKEAQVDKIAHDRRESLRTLENRFAPRTNVFETDLQASGAPASSPPTAATSTSPSQLSYNEDRPMSTHAAVSGGPGLTRSGAISGRTGPPPPAFFTRRFGPRPASFVNPRSGDAPRPLGRLPTITAATRHYEPAKRTVPTSSEAAVTETVNAHTGVDLSAGPRPPAAGTPSWLAHIPTSERSHLPAPMNPIRLHIPDDEGPVLQGSFGFNQSRTESPVAAPPTTPSVQRPLPASSGGDLDDPRTIALLRRPPPPPPAFSTSSTQVAALPGQGSSRPFAIHIAQASSITEARVPQSSPSNVRARAPFRSATRPLPSIPTTPAGNSDSQAERTSAPTQPSSTTGPIPSGSEEVLEGEALLQRARSTLRRPPRREPSLGITDLDLLVSELERNGDHYEDLNAISEFLGPAKSTKPTAAELAALSIAKVELDRRRVDRAGKVKQKLSVVGVRVDRCGICLNQFKEGEECCIYPCWHIFHNKPCATQVLLNSRLCPMCRKDIAGEEA
ncbi:hypothetical protein OC861_000037 [Tilletia horrida]|nr:hypothetical protein OC861_000037 [Tilletia horrida]